MAIKQELKIIVVVVVFGRPFVKRFALLSDRCLSCLSVLSLFLSWVVHKRLNRSICRFGLRIRVGRKKHKFNCIRKMAPLCTISIVFAGRRQYTQRHSAVSCAKMAERIDLPFELWTRVGRKKHKFSRIRQVAPPPGATTWQIRLNCPSAAAMRSYVKLLWPLVEIVSAYLDDNFEASLLWIYFCLRPRVICW